MKILFTGATGVLGKAAVPMLLAEDHDVIGVHRDIKGKEWLQEVGARTTAVDLFDGVAISEVMAGIDTVIHFATSIPPQDIMSDPSRWILNDKLRSTATSLLVDAALANGVERFIQQSVVFVYEDGGDRWLDEASPVAPAWSVLDSALVAESHVARFRERAGVGVTLRLGRLYGPGPASEDFISAVGRRRLPIIGTGDNFVSSIHVDDAATALIASLSVPSGTYNVSDQSPMRSGPYLETLSEELGARKPRRVPEWLAKRLVGDASKMLTISHRVDNSAFHNATGWEPSFPSIVEGWADVVARRRAD